MKKVSCMLFFMLSSNSSVQNSGGKTEKWKISSMLRNVRIRLRSLWFTPGLAVCSSWVCTDGIHLQTRVFPGGDSGKETACQCRRLKRHGFDPWVGKMPWRRTQQPAPVFSPGKSHEQGGLTGHSPWGRKGLDMTEQLSMEYIILEPNPLSILLSLLYRWPKGENVHAALHDCMIQTWTVHLYLFTGHALKHVKS